MVLKFYIVFLYTFQTRYNNTIKGVIKWLFEYLAPTLFCFILASNGSVFSIFQYILVTFLIYNIYEIGYIQNDAETIKKEICPKLRLTPVELDYYEKHRNLIYFSKILFGLILSFILLFDLNFSFGSFFAIGAAWMILVIYLFYNSIRGKISFILHFLLMILRYSTGLLLFIPNLPCEIWVLSLLIFPFPVILQVLGMGKFGIQFSITKLYLKNYSDRYIFRIWYYLILSIFYFVGSFIYKYTMVISLLPFCFFCYETGIYFALHKKKITA